MLSWRDGRGRGEAWRGPGGDGEGRQSGSPRRERPTESRIEGGGRESESTRGEGGERGDGGSVIDTTIISSRWPSTPKGLENLRGIENDLRKRRRRKRRRRMGWKSSK